MTRNGVNPCGRIIFPSMRSKFLSRIFRLIGAPADTSRNDNTRAPAAFMPSTDMSSVTLITLSFFATWVNTSRQRNERGRRAAAISRHAGQGNSAEPASPRPSSRPNIRFIFCSACPAAPFTRLSITHRITAGPDADRAGCRAI